MALDVDPYLRRHDIARILAAPVVAMWADLSPEGRRIAERVLSAQLMAFGVAVRVKEVVR